MDKDQRIDDQNRIRALRLTNITLQQELNDALQALGSIRQVLDGSQPKDPIGAYFIADSALDNVI